MELSRARAFTLAFLTRLEDAGPEMICMTWPTSVHDHTAGCIRATGDTDILNPITKAESS